MKAIKIIFTTLIVGVILLLYSWFSSFPLSVQNTGDYVFNSISLFYWIGLALVLVSLYGIILVTNNNYLRWLSLVALVLSMYSLSYFYSLLPGSDSHYFRGLTEYFFQNEGSQIFNWRHYYFEWPGFFITSKIVTMLSGLELNAYQFVQYSLMGFILVTGLYLNLSGTIKKNSSLAVISYFIILFYFLNFQNVPFTLAFCLFILLLMIEKIVPKSFGKVFLILLFFIAITATHSFVPLFYLSYQFVLYLVNKDRTTLSLFVINAVFFFLYQITRAPLSFVKDVRMLLTSSSEYSATIQTTVQVSSNSIDAFAQLISRAVIVSTAALCLLGFILLILKRGTKNHDKAVFIIGFLYSIGGVFTFLLGTRALSIFMVPLSLGVAYLVESKFTKRFKPFIIAIFVLLLLFFPFVPLHGSFSNEDIQFQTIEAYDAANMLLDNYDLSKDGNVLADYRVVTYFESRMGGDEQTNFIYDPLMTHKADVLFYTIGLGNKMIEKNTSLQQIYDEERLNVVFNNGYSKILINADK